MAATILRDEFWMEKKDVRPIIRQGDALVGGEEIPLETQAEKALELAIREALILGCSWVGTEHILLGLSRAPGEISELLERRCGGAGFAETIRLKVVERLRGPKEEPDIEDTEQASAEAEHKAQVMELRDVLGDVLTGFKMWRDRKVSDMSLDNDDEAFIRWLEAGSASDYLD